MLSQGMGDKTILAATKELLLGLNQEDTESEYFRNDRSFV
jgi:hypothetical protein